MNLNLEGCRRSTYEEFKLGNHLDMKTCVERAGRRTFRMNADFYPAVRRTKNKRYSLTFP
jgi:hypothetical protein